LAGENKESGVTTYFYLPQVTDKDSIALTYFSKQGDTLARFSRASSDKDRKLEPHSGLNKHNWDTRGEGALRLEGMILWWASLEAPKAVPGEYEVELEVNGSTIRKTLKLLPDPRAEVSVSQMQEQFDFISDINSTIDQAHRTIRQIRTIRAKLKSFKDNYGDQKNQDSLLARAEEIGERLESIEKTLYQTRNRSSQDPLNFPIKLTNKLAHINSLVSIDDFPPTEQDKAVRAELTAAIEKELAEFREVINSDIQAFNEAFTEARLPFLTVKED
jgi:hypothetical protein